jgi:BirA family transcriptional regulator, biotin operon repressor / biotin---[acetyl-CoA-carboxylase] ligase
MSEPLPRDLESALARSADRRGPFGEPVVFFSETGSTNDIAIAMAERGAREGAMAIAAAQTAGRGRMGREWFSPEGAGLYVSVVCRSARAAPLLTLASGVAVADGIHQATGLPVVLKWPNDVVIPDSAAPGKRRKLAGVLAEGSTGPDGLQYVVLGFGINLRSAAYPPAIAARTTSIEAELGRSVDRGAVLAETLSLLNQHVSALARGNTADLFRRWRELAPSACGARVEWTVNGQTHRGTTTGIDDQGALLVREQNRTERIIAGEVTWL